MNITLDELHVFNYPLNQQEIKQVIARNFTIPQFPIDNGKVHPDNVIITWKNNSNDMVRAEVAEDPQFRNIVYSQRNKIGLRLPKLKNNTQYFWRVAHSKSSRSDRISMVRNFTTDDTTVPMSFTLRDIELKDAKQGVSGYGQKLQGFVTEVTGTTLNKLTFKKISDPDWLRVLADGYLFTNYGATQSDRGNNTFKEMISAPDGNSQIITFTVEVV